jgi:hypothetical protein
MRRKPLCHGAFLPTTGFLVVGRDPPRVARFGSPAGSRCARCGIRKTAQRRAFSSSGIRGPWAAGFHNGFGNLRMPRKCLSHNGSTHDKRSRPRPGSQTLSASSAARSSDQAAPSAASFSISGSVRCSWSTAISLSLTHFSLGSRSYPSSLNWTLT